jgi:biopolymer transport protein ExbD
VDAAPFAGLFFATMLFMVLFYSHAFFPGVPVTWGSDDEPAELTDRNVRVLKDGDLRFEGELYELAGFQADLANRAKRGELPKRVVLESEPGAPEDVVARVENLLTDAGVPIKLPGTRLDLPEDAGFAGVPNPVVVVGVNLNGQIFYQHQKIQETALQLRLAEAVEKAGEPLTLLLQADRDLPLERVTELSRIARKAGIAQVVIGTRPGLM